MAVLTRTIVVRHPVTDRATPLVAGSPCPGWAVGLVSPSALADGPVEADVVIPDGADLPDDVVVVEDADDVDAPAEDDDVVIVEDDADTAPDDTPPAPKRRAPRKRNT